MDGFCKNLGFGVGFGYHNNTKVNGMFINKLDVTMTLYTVGALGFL